MANGIMRGVRNPGASSSLSARPKHGIVQYEYMPWKAPSWDGTYQAYQPNTSGGTGIVVDNTTTDNNVVVDTPDVPRVTGDDGDTPIQTTEGPDIDTGTVTPHDTTTSGDPSLSSTIQLSQGASKSDGTHWEQDDLDNYYLVTDNKGIFGNEDPESRGFWERVTGKEFGDTNLGSILQGDATKSQLKDAAIWVAAQFVPGGYLAKKVYDKIKSKLDAKDIAEVEAAATTGTGIVDNTVVDEVEGVDEVEVVDEVVDETIGQDTGVPIYEQEDITSIGDLLPPPAISEVEQNILDKTASEDGSVTGKYYDGEEYDSPAAAQDAKIDADNKVAEELAATELADNIAESQSNPDVVTNGQFYKGKDWGTPAAANRQKAARTYRIVKTGHTGWKRRSVYTVYFDDGFTSVESRDPQAYADQRVQQLDSGEAQPSSPAPPPPPRVVTTTPSGGGDDGGNYGAGTRSGAAGASEEAQQAEQDARDANAAAGGYTGGGQYGGFNQGGPVYANTGGIMGRKMMRRPQKGIMNSQRRKPMHRGIMQGRS